VLVKKKISRKKLPENLKFKQQSSRQVLYKGFKLMLLSVRQTNLHSKQTAWASVRKIIIRRKHLELGLVSKMRFRNFI
jgi:hypothetical protein